MAPIEADALPIEIGSGNVFADLALPETALRLAKAERARAIKQVIASRDWTQAHAAHTAGITAPDMSEICGGKLAKFSVERLDSVLLRLGVNIDVRLRPTRTGALGTLRVTLR